MAIVVLLLMMMLIMLMMLLLLERQRGRHRVRLRLCSRVREYTLGITFHAQPLIPTTLSHKLEP
jgi:hypothetical protein